MRAGERRSRLNGEAAAPPTHTWAESSICHGDTEKQTFTGQQVSQRTHADASVNGCRARGSESVRSARRMETAVSFPESSSVEGLVSREEETAERRTRTIRQV